MLQAILGWYSLVLILLALCLNISSEKKGGVRLLSVLLHVPVVAYICLKLF